MVIDYYHSVNNQHELMDTRMMMATLSIDIRLEFTVHQLDADTVQHLEVS